jgi:hypothetical protein
MILFNGFLKSHSLILSPLTRKPHHQTNIHNTKRAQSKGVIGGKILRGVEKSSSSPSSLPTSIDDKTRPTREYCSSGIFGGNPNPAQVNT